MSATIVARAGKQGNICVGNNVSATVNVSSFARTFILRIAVYIFAIFAYGEELKQTREVPLVLWVS